MHGFNANVLCVSSVESSEFWGIQRWRALSPHLNRLTIWWWEVDIFKQWGMCIHIRVLFIWESKTEPGVVGRRQSGKISWMRCPWDETLRTDKYVSVSRSGSRVREIRYTGKRDHISKDIKSWNSKGCERNYKHPDVLGGSKEGSGQCEMRLVRRVNQIRGPVCK